MMLFKRIVSVLLVLIIIATLLTGCNKNKNVKYDYNSNVKINTVSSSIVAQNNNFILHWDDNAKCILFENKKTGKIWSNVPLDMYENGETCSTLDISVQDMELYQSEFISGEEPLNSNKISCEKIEDGIKVTYYFDSVQISIPVSYVLRDDSLVASINGSEIEEKGEKYRLFYVAVSPKLCSVSNEATNSYIFVPEGNGALMYTNVDADGSRKVEIEAANVASHDVTSNTNQTETSGMRVFGIKDNDNAMLCIAENTPSAVGIYASAGDKKSDYSNVYPVYFFADYDYFYGKATNAAAVRHLSDRCQSTISVGFYPLENEEANYNGMAARYRGYLIDSGYINEKHEITNSPYAVTILGGVNTTSSIMGIPVKTMKSMTTFNQAKTIIENISEVTGIKPKVRLSGFTESGINYGEIAGGYDFASKLGSKKDRLELEDYCKDNNISLYSEFEMIKYNKTGSGFSYTSDSAKTAILYSAEKSGVNVPLRDYNENISFRFLKRSKIKDAVDKMEKTITQKQISGVCLSSLGELSYSDYSEGMDYAVASKIDTDTKQFVTQLKNTNSNVAVSAGTYFSAGLADDVFDAPLDISGMYQYDVEIPFYQLVFSGITPLYSTAVNMSANPDEKIMMAASTGTGLGFTVLNNFEKSYMETTSEKLFACVYSENVDLIKDSLKEYNEIYSAINNSKITSYEFLDENLTKTVFENGVVVYANHSSDEINSPIGKLLPYGFGMEREEI